MFDKTKFYNEAQKHERLEPGRAYIIIALIEIRESIDRYIEQRIKSDKTLEGILKDIYSAVQESGS